MSVSTASPEPALPEGVKSSVVVATTDAGLTGHGAQPDNNNNMASTMGEAQDTTAGKYQSSPPAKRLKRGKYIARACTACQQRKIKVSPRLNGGHEACPFRLAPYMKLNRPQCEGGDPCAHCRARGRVCESTARVQPKQTSRATGPGSVDGTLSVDSLSVSNSSNPELAARVAQLERQMSIMQQSLEGVVGDSTTGASLRRESGPSGHGHGRGSESPSPACAQLQKVMEPDGQSFMGELSMTSNLIEAEGSGEESSDNIIKLAVNLPWDRPSRRNKSSRKVRGWLESVLQRYGVVADEEDWREYMELFFEEIHILYPILHPPAVWHTFNGLWEYGALWPMTDSVEREEKRLSVALVCICLALGRCCVSTRMTDATGVHSSGWSLCSVAMELIQDSERIGKRATTSLLNMQIQLLRVMYYFRLDATQEAARLTALAVSNAHILGIHQQSRLDTLPCFYSQLLSRIWWCIFILDRRMAIESGRPFLIQECNTDTALPLDLSDEWLSQLSRRPETAEELQAEIRTELTRKHVSAIPFLVAMVRYSRVVSKAWELIYGVKASSKQPVSHMIDYADTVLSNLLETLPDDLTYNPDLPTQTQFGSRKRWQVKQTMLLSTCVTFLRIFIRRPSMQGKCSTEFTTDDQLESLTICASLAANILNAHKDLKDRSMKHCFPYCHYLISCTMVMVSLVANKPALVKRHREAILAAMQSLRLYCHTIWVSGKMMRWVSKLTLLARRVLQAEPPDLSATAAAGAREEDTIQPQQLTPQSTIRDLSQDSGIPRRDSISSQRKASYYGGPNVAPGAAAAGAKPQPQAGGSSGRTSGSHYPEQLSHMWIMGDGELGSSGGAEGGLESLPEWAMMDFNFEAMSGDVFGAGSGGGDAGFKDAGFKDTGDQTHHQGNEGTDLEMNMGETMLDGMPHGIYGLDMSLD